MAEKPLVGELDRAQRDPSQEVVEDVPGKGKLAGAQARRRRRTEKEKEKRCLGGASSGALTRSSNSPKALQAASLIIELNLDDEPRLLSSDHSNHGVIPLSTTVYISGSGLGYRSKRSVEAIRES